MWTGKMTKTTIVFMVMLIGLSWANSESARAGTVIDNVRLAPDTLPEGWKLIKAYDVPEANIRRFEAKFAVPVTEMLNQEFRVDGEKAVQINYLASSLETYVNTIYRVMVEMVGFENVIVRKGSVCMEIISDSDDLKKRAVELLEPSSLQKRKLNATTAPETWRLVKEFFVTEEELKLFENKFEAGLEEIVNQFFIIGDQALRVNYIAAKSVDDADAVLKKLEIEVGKVNLILKKDNMVMEVITPSEALKKEASAVLGGI